MNELEQIKAQLNDINNKIVRISTLKEQAMVQCEEIEKKYNVHSPQELLELVNKANVEYQEEVTRARDYIQHANSILNEFNGLC